MYLELAALAYLVGRYVYNEHIKDKPAKKRPEREIKIPRVDPGSPIPLVFGRCRVRAPVLAWFGPVNWEDAEISGVVVRREWRMDMFFHLGIGFPHYSVNSLADVTVHGMWAGDRRFSNSNGWETRNGAGGFEQWVDATFVSLDGGGSSTGGDAEVLFGYDTQALVAAGVADTYSAQQMIAAGVPAADIPGYRGLISVLLFQEGHPLGYGWLLGRALSVPAYSWEVSSYATNHSQLGTYARVGLDSNPINAIFALLTMPQGLGGLGIPESRIDMASFQKEQLRLHNESHGYSRAIESAEDARSVLDDILSQIDGLLYVEPLTGKIVVKLFRNDYETSNLFVINRRNCRRLEGVAIGGRDNTVNKVQVVFSDRESDYEEDSEIAIDMASIVAAGNLVKEQIVQMPGITNRALALSVAQRILQTLSRPALKCTAYCDRSAMRLRPGDPVILEWQEPDIARAVMRVLDVSHGTLEEGTVRLDLVQTAEYVFAGKNPKPPLNIVIDSPPVDLG